MRIEFEGNQNFGRILERSFCLFISFSFKEQFIKNIILAYLSFGSLILIALLSLGRYLYLIRDDIKDISKQIEELPNMNWSKSLKIKKPKRDYWPEILYTWLVVSIVLFILSLVNLKLC